MPWAYIYRLLGPGLHWGRTREELHTAIARAESDGQLAAAQHLRVILGLRDAVAFDAPAAEKHPTGVEQPMGQTAGRPVGEAGRNFPAEGDTV